jgi:hypothetical protein
MRSLIRAVYRFRDATLVAKKKDDFENALQNLLSRLGTGGGFGRTGNLSHLLNRRFLRIGVIGIWHVEFAELA